jgi:sugar-specific transcriptional regulator TrmB
MILQNYLEVIKQSGFSDYEAKCYLALFNKDSLTVSEIARLAEIPRPSAYDAMEKLMTRGLCSSIPGKSKKYAAANPRILKDQMMDNFTNHMKAIDNLTIELEKLYESGLSNGNSLESIEILRNPRQIDDKFVQLLRESKTEMLTLSKHKFNEVEIKADLMKAFEFQVKLETDLIKKGLSSKCIYEIGLDDKRNIKLLFDKAINRYVEAGQQARVMKDLPMRMAIFDGKITMFTLVDDVGISSSFLTQVVRSEVMAKSHKLLFDMLWEKAEDYEAYKKRLNI